MTVDYFLEHRESFQVIPCLESTLLPFIMVAIFLLVSACLFFKALKETELVKKVIGMIVPSIFVLAMTLVFIPNIIDQSHLSWVMNDTYLILYDEEVSDFRNVWEWEDLSAHLSDYEESDFDNRTSTYYYQIQLVNKDGTLVYKFEYTSLETLARQVQPFAKYLPNFSEQISSNSLISREATQRFLNIFNELQK